MSCEVIRTECLRVGDKVPITLDFSLVAARHWRRGATIPVNQRIRAKKSGYEYEATTAGQTGNSEPMWPLTLDATVNDGSVVWTARAISLASLLKILVSVVWTVPTGLTKSGESADLTNQTAEAYIEAVTAGSYEVIVTPTFNDSPAHAEGFAIAIEVE